MNQQLLWEQIRPTIENLTCEIDGCDHYVWGTPDRMYWLESAWNALSRKNLTFCESPAEKAQVRLQSLTLTVIFCRYLEIVEDFSVFIDYFSWFEDSKIDPVHLEMITGKAATLNVIEQELQNKYGLADYDSYPDYDSCTNIDGDGEVFYDEVIDDISEEKVAAAFKAAIDMQHSQVVSALLDEFGGAQGLYGSLDADQSDPKCLDWIDAGMPIKCCQLGADYS